MRTRTSNRALPSTGAKETTGSVVGRGGTPGSSTPVQKRYPAANPGSAPKASVTTPASGGTAPSVPAYASPELAANAIESLDPAALVELGDTSFIDSLLALSVDDGGDPNSTASNSMAATVASMPDSAPSPSTAPEAFAAEATKGPAQELPHRKEMEKAYDIDLREVSAHLGVEAPLYAMQAHALAMPRPGMDQPAGTAAFASTQPSKQVVAHEVAHFKQALGSTTTSVPIAA